MKMKMKMKNNNNIIYKNDYFKPYKKYFINKTYNEYYISFKMASGINNLTEKYIQRYNRIKNKYLKKINKTEDQVIIKSYKIITDNIKNTDNINPKDDNDNDNEDKPISFYKMIPETEGINNTYNRNRRIYLYALNKGNIRKINDEKMKYYDIVYDQDTNTYIKNPENIKPKDDNDNDDKPISFYKMIAETEGINTYKRNRSLYLYALNKGIIQTINDEKMKYYDIIYDQDNKKYIRNPENIKPKEKKKRVYKPNPKKVKDKNKE